MTIKIKLTKQMLVTTKLAAIMQMPEETEKINKYFSEDSEEEIDFDLSLLDAETRQRFAIMFGMCAIAQKAKENGES